MSEGDKQLSAISGVLRSKPVLPGELQSGYHLGLSQLIAELEARGVLQVYLAEKIYDCLWLIMSYEEQKRAVTLTRMVEIATEHLMAGDALNEREFR